MAGEGSDAYDLVLLLNLIDQEVERLCPEGDFDAGASEGEEIKVDLEIVEPELRHSEHPTASTWHG